MRVPAHTASMDATPAITPTTRTLVCAPPLVIEGLLAIGCEVTLRTGFLQQVPALAARTLPDLVIIHADAAFRDVALDVVRRVRAQAPGTRVVLLMSAPDLAAPCEVLPQDVDAASLRTMLGVGAHIGGPALTPREVAVLRLAADGLTNRAIGTQLGIAENTVKNHLRHVHQKLDVRSRTEAVLVAARAGHLVLRTR